jgi:hypothetical protein
MNKRHINFYCNLSLLFLCCSNGLKRQIQFCKYHEKKINLMQIHLHEVKILQIHNARPEFVKNITAINQSESSILI